MEIGLRSTIKNVAARTRKIFEGYFNQTISIPPSMNTQDFLKAYGEIGWLFACVNAISNNVADSEWKAYKGDAETPKSPALQLISNPNPFMSQYELLWKTDAYLEVRGKVFWYIAKDKMNRPREIWVISPLDMWIVPDQENFIKGFVYRAGAQQVPLDPDEVIFFNMPDLINPYNGIGPAQAAANSLETDRYSSQWNRNFFYNNAEPQGIMTFPEVNDDDFDALKEKWNDKYGGIDNAKKLAIVRGTGITYTPIQISQKDMDFSKLRDKSRDEILGAFGVPKSILGITENVNRANAETAEYTFAKHIIRPRLRLIQEKINNELVTLFKDGIKLKFTDPVPENKDFIKTVVDTQVNKTLTVNEGRRIIAKLLGEKLEDIDGGNVLYQANSLIPIGSPAPEPAPAEETDPEVQPNEKPEGGQEGENLNQPTKQLKKKIVNLVTDKEQYWKDFVAKAEQNEKKIAPVWSEIFQEQKDQIIANLKNRKSIKSNNDDEEYAALFAFLETTEEKRKIKNKVKPVITDIYAEKAQQAIDQLDIDYSFDLQNPEVTKWFEDYCLDQTDLINQTTKDLITEQLKEGEKNGESINDLVKRIEQYFSTFEGWRVQTIARTETIASSNAGTLAGYKQSSVVKKKGWLTSMDGRERESHAHADGQIVGLDDNFQLDGGEGPAPGQIGTPEEDCNCRCTIIAVFDDE